MASLGAVLGAGDLDLVSRMLPVTVREASWNPDVVRFDAGIEPLVRLLEQTPREQVLGEFAARIRKGTPYRDVLAALHLAGIRNVPPRPDVGWKFHCVLVLHAAHLASLAAADRERWIPVFFALDFFKTQQAYDERESTWSMPAVEEKAVAAVPEPRAAFEQAMDAWDDDAADAAAAALARTANRDEIVELLTWYGMRDFRNIGHKPIYVGNGWRTLDVVGRQHTEPFVRSLVYALLNHAGQPNPSTSELEADAPWRANQERLERIGAGWAGGALSESATTELLATLRTGTWSEASEHVAELLQGDVAPQSVQDALFAGAAEQLMRQPGIVSLHGVTATNALAWAWRTARSERTRKLILLQNAAFLVQFREVLSGDGPFGGAWGDARIDELEPLALEEGSEPLEEIFHWIGRDGVTAARKTFAWLRSADARPDDFLAAARRSSMLRCRNGHDYKFTSAVAEDCAHVSPAWRDRYLAASVHYLRGMDAPPNALVRPTLELLKA